MSEMCLANQVSVFTHQYDYPSTILINEKNIESGHLFKIIFDKGQIIRYSNATTQIDDDILNANSGSLLKNASTVTEYNLSNSQISNENQTPEFTIIDTNFNDNENSIFSEEEISDNEEEEDFDELSANPNQQFVFNNYINTNNGNTSENIFSTNSNKIIVSPFREKNSRKSRINLTPEARRFRDSFYKCYGDKKRFSKMVVRNIHNSICGSLGLPKMSRSEYRSILLYFNNYAPYRQKIIQAINMKKGFILDPRDRANARIFAMH